MGGIVCRHPCITPGAKTAATTSGKSLDLQQSSSLSSPPYEKISNENGMVVTLYEKESLIRKEDDDITTTSNHPIPSQLSLIESGKKQQSQNSHPSSQSNSPVPSTHHAHSHVIEGSPPKPHHGSYDYSQSTETNHHVPNSKFVGKYQKERSLLDYSYHKTYSEERQLFQDTLIEKFLKTLVYDEKHDWYCESPLENWIVFTAGVMGAGKGRTMNWLAKEKLFPREAFVNVDPDEIRHLLPEFPGYNKFDLHKAGYMTQKEVGYISEILSYHALEAKKNVLIDGSLRDAYWYGEYFKNLRATFPTIKLAIIFVHAPIETVIQRANARALVTGRHVPEELIRLTADAIPESLAVLTPKVECYCQLINENHRETYPEYCEMKKKDGDYMKVCWSMTPEGDKYKVDDIENQEELLLDNWKPTFKDIWTMTCEVPMLWAPHPDEVKRKSSRL